MFTLPIPALALGKSLPRGVTLTHTDVEASLHLSAPSTNNAAELNAILLALHTLDRLEGQGKIVRGQEIVIMTGSSYAQGNLEKGWKARKNADLVARVRAAYDERRLVNHIRVRLVRAQRRGSGGDRADTLARTAALGAPTKTTSQPKLPVREFKEEGDTKQTSSPLRQPMPHAAADGPDDPSMRDDSDISDDKPKDERCPSEVESGSDVDMAQRASDGDDAAASGQQENAMASRERPPPATAPSSPKRRKRRGRSRSPLRSHARLHDSSSDDGAPISRRTRLRLRRASGGETGRPPWRG